MTFAQALINQVSEDTEPRAVASGIEAQAWIIGLNFSINQHSHMNKG